jgi:hypothetical protein
MSYIPPRKKPWPLDSENAPERIEETHDVPCITTFAKCRTPAVLRVGAATYCTFHAKLHGHHVPA